MAVLELVFSSFWVFLGTCVLISLVGNFLVKLLRALRCK